MMTSEQLLEWKKIIETHFKKADAHFADIEMQTMGMLFLMSDYGCASIPKELEKCNDICRIVSIKPKEELIDRYIEEDVGHLRSWIPEKYHANIQRICWYFIGSCDEYRFHDENFAQRDLPLAKKK